MRIDARDQGGLAAIVDACHDMWFDVAQITFDQARGVVRIPFDHRGTKRVGVGSAPVELEIRYVVRCVVMESEGVGCYDFNEFEYSAVTQRLTIHTGIPLTFYVDVSDLHVTALAPAPNEQ